MPIRRVLPPPTAVNDLTKAMLGLGNVDNTSDAAKPLSTAAIAALALKANIASPAFTGTVTFANDVVISGDTYAYGNFVSQGGADYLGNLYVGGSFSAIGYVYIDDTLEVEQNIIAHSLNGTGDRVAQVNSTGQFSAPKSVDYLVPVGAMMMWPNASAPSGWLLCQGQSLARAGTYAALYTVLGTTYGAVDGVSFSLPDMRQRVPVGLKSTVPAYSILGGVGGSERVTLTGPQSGIAQHQHGVGTLDIGNDSPDHSHQGTEYYNTGTIANQNTGGQTDWNQQTTRTVTTGGASVRHQHPITGATADAGPTTAAQDHENMPPYLVVNYIIKY